MIIINTLIYKEGEVFRQLIFYKQVDLDPTKSIFHLKLLYSNGLKPYVYLITTTIPFLEFSIQFQSNNLIYDKEYSKRTLDFY